MVAVFSAPTSLQAAPKNNTHLVVSSKVHGADGRGSWKVCACANTVGVAKTYTEKQHSLDL